MKSLLLYEAGDLRCEEIEIPKITPGNVLVKVKAVGVCGSDIPRVNIYGAYQPRTVMGHEFSGEIVEVNEAGAWKKGDRVVVPPLIPCGECHWCQSGNYSLCENYDYFGSRRNGAMAEYVDVPITNLLALPDGVSYEAAAMVDPAANAIHAIWNGTLQAGDTVAVYGCGPIGMFAIQFAKILGAKSIIAVDLKKEKLDVAQEIGADYVINCLESDPVKEINQITNGNGVNLVLETSGSPIAQNQCVCSAGKLGKAVFVGISHRNLELTKEAVNNILRRELIIKGSWNSFSNPFPGKEWTYSLQMMDEGKLKTDPLVSHRLPLEEGPAIFKKFSEKDFFFNKVLFLP